MTDHPGDALSRRRRLGYVFLLGTLTALGPFTIDLYLPAFPGIAHEFGATTGHVQLTLTATAIGIAVGQLVVGPLSDRIGRRTPVVVATGLHVLGGVGIVLAPTLDAVALFRVVQGVGAAAGGVVALAVVRDLFGGRPLARMLSRLALVNGVAPVIAPVIGSQLLRISDWRGLFVFLGAYALCCLAAALVFLPETHPRATRSGGPGVIEGYRTLFGDRVFVGTVIVGGLVFSSILTYVSSSPFLFQDLFDTSPQEFGLWFAVNSLGLILGTQIAPLLMRRFRPAWLLVGGLLGIGASAILLVVLATTDLGIWTIAAPFLALVTSCGFCLANVQVLALADHAREAATAASLLSASFSFGAALISPIPGMIGLASGAVVGQVILACAIVAILVTLVVIRPISVPRLTE